MNTSSCIFAAFAFPPPWQRFGRLAAMLGLLTLLAACASPQTYSTTQILATNLRSDSLKSAGLAFITPSSVTGQEEDKQALALAFGEALRQARPDLHIISLSETLSSINRAGLTSEYKQMFEDYRLTGIFDRTTLRKVADVVHVRYLAQLKLGGFRQDSKGRWGALGLRLVETKSTALRLYLQIWDSEDGSVVWEGAHEMTASHDSMAEDTVTFRSVTEQAARALVGRMP